MLAVSRSFVSGRNNCCLKDLDCAFLAVVVVLVFFRVRCTFLVGVSYSTSLGSSLIEIIGRISFQKKEYIVRM